MTLIRLSPLRDLVSMQTEMNRLFDDFFARSTENPDHSQVWNPMVDISETESEIRLVAELPGLTKDQIKISVQENVLTLEGEKIQEQEEKGKCYHRVERGHGKFQRSFVLPTAVKGDQIGAKFKDGILTVSLPKAEEAKPKQIQISVK